MENQWMEALGIGLISAVSLPLGALLSMFWTPKSKIVAMLLSFGGGALLAALTIDLVAEKKDEFLPLSIGCVAGGILYELLNIIVNSKGGFLRKTSTIIGHLKKKKTARYKEIAQKLSVVPLFNSLPADEVQALLLLWLQKHIRRERP
jgi:zinc transporter ZupT